MIRVPYEDLKFDPQPLIGEDDRLLAALDEIHKDVPGKADYDPALDLPQEKYIESRATGILNLRPKAK